MGDSSKPSFTFINISHPNELRDQEMLTHIRCSAMSSFGKQLRSKRAGKKKRKKIEIVFELREPGLLPLSRVGVTAADPFDSTRLGWDAETTGLMTNIFGANDGQRASLLESWQHIAFYDEYCFQTAKAVAAVNVEMLQHHRLIDEDTLQSSKHYGKAIRMVNQKLNDPKDHTSYSVLGTITGLVTHDWLIGNFQGWKWHMEGMIKIIHLRGGIDAFDQKHLHVTLGWLDVCGAYSQDLRPYLPMPKAWDESMQISLRSLRPDTENHNTVLDSWSEELPGSDSWLSIFKDLTRLFGNPQVPANSWMEPTIYRLLAFRPLETRITRDAIIEEVCRIGGLLFLAPLWRTFGVMAIRTACLRRNLLTLLQSHFAEWGLLHNLFLWTLVNAAREADSDREREQFVLMIVIVMRKIDVEDWSGLIDLLKGVIWDNAVKEKDWELVRKDVDVMAG